ncbi:MerR family transcriptional regulator [Alkalimarinus sediminis]|uniref:MerR family transcriptional regulator n=1 Tax=Alkalimarinus sediminis TaxID=1632866 RepID=A0A9E8HLE7_9ALTE|nr:MerR family transcriptional regulator [Alkalimarinus sediminis]UZW76277.1 MerR family transcriptional regulator [Alkalimarinus sediminis]
MKVNELATKVGVTPDTVRFYTRVGLLNPTKNLDNGYKNYGLADQKRLVFIVKSRHLGFSVSEIQEVIGMSSQGNSPCCRVRSIVKNRLNEALCTIDELQQLAERMEKAVDAWENLPDGQPTGDSVCNLIEMWDDIEVGQLSLNKCKEIAR